MHTYTLNQLGLQWTSFNNRYFFPYLLIRSVRDASASVYSKLQLQCCGVEGPDSWQRNLEYPLLPIFDDNGYIATTTSTKYPIQMPASCCTSGSGYQKLRCDNYFQKGCLDKTHEITLEAILTIDSVALAVAVAQVKNLTVICFYLQ